MAKADDRKGGVKTEAVGDTTRQRVRVSQEDVPAYSLEQALRVARAIADSYAYKPTRPLNVAGAMKITPASSTFRMLTGAAIAYGVTTGGAYAPEIALTPLGTRIVRPTKPGDDVSAKREALLKPRIIGEFLRQYDGAAIPAEQIAKNVLVEKGVPSERVDDVLALILEGAESVGFLREMSGKKYVDLAGSVAVDTEEAAAPSDAELGLKQSDRRPKPLQPVVSPAVNVNVQIHIAADATSETIEEIFKNMRRYVLGSDEPEVSE